MGKVIDEIRAIPADRGGRPRLIDEYLDGLPDAEAADLRAALADPSITPAQLWKWLGDHGLKVERSTVVKWTITARRS